jgi:hypothetical protein
MAGYIRAKMRMWSRRRGKEQGKRNPRGTYFQVTSLPPALQRALRGIGYNRKDIAVSPATTFSVSGSAGKGTRAVVVVLNMATGAKKTFVGAWGGPTSLDQRQADLDASPRPLPPQGAVIKATEGGERPLYASILMHPEAMPHQVEEQEELPVGAAFALVALAHLNSKGRREAFSRAAWDSNLSGVEIGTYGSENPHIQDLIRRGWAKATRSGAVSATTEGKNHRSHAEKMLRDLGIYV